MGLLQEQLARIEATVDRIDANSERNPVVAEKCGDRADTLFSVVDSVGTVMNRVKPLTYLPTGLLSDGRAESNGGDDRADRAGDDRAGDDRAGDDRAGDDRADRAGDSDDGGSFVDYYSNLN